MQILLLLLGALIVVLLGLFIYSMYLPSAVKIERVRELAAAPAVVFAELDHLPDWPHWAPWVRKDPKISLRYGDIASGVGATFSWNSRKAVIGKGRLLITASRPPEYLAADMYTFQQGLSKLTFRLELAGSGTRVTWTMVVYVGKNPISKLMGRRLERWVGPDLEEGLHRLDIAAGQRL